MERPVDLVSTGGTTSIDGLRQMEKNPNTSPMTAWKELKKQNYPGGVKLTTKELRDYFATQVSAQVNDPNTVKALMRHTSLNTTSRYTRTVAERTFCIPLDVEPR
jgi:integrase